MKYQGIELNKKANSYSVLNSISIFFALVLIYLIIAFFGSYEIYFSAIQIVLIFGVLFLIFFYLIKSLFMFLTNVYLSIAQTFSLVLKFFRYFDMYTFPFLTKYYPFSLFWQNSFYHVKNKKELFILQNIQKTTHKLGKFFYIKSLYKEIHFYVIRGRFIKTKKRFVVKNVINEIEKDLKIPKNSIYIRKDKDNLIRLLVPNEYNYSY